MLLCWSVDESPITHYSTVSGVVVKDYPSELVDCGRKARSDVHDLSNNFVAGQRQQVSVHHVGNVNEIPGLCPVTIDRQGEILLSSVEECPYDSGIGTGRLSRAVDIKVSQDSCLQVECSVEEAAVPLTFQFRSCIWR